MYEKIPRIDNRILTLHTSQGGVSEGNSFVNGKYFLNILQTSSGTNLRLFSSILKKPITNEK